MKNRVSTGSDSDRVTRQFSCSTDPVAIAPGTDPMPYDAWLPSYVSR